MNNLAISEGAITQAKVTVSSRTDSSDATASVGQAASPRKNRARAGRSVEGAVFGYIQAIRALGRTRVTTFDVATALSLTETEVLAVVAALRKKGVKVAE
jgi:hypothetical protein